jgi:hypothetical protein
MARNDEANPLKTKKKTATSLAQDTFYSKQIGLLNLFKINSFDYYKYPI